MSLKLKNIDEFIAQIKYYTYFCKEIVENKTYEKNNYI